MTLTMTAEDVSQKARGLFPCFKAECGEWAFFENAGGSQVRISLYVSRGSALLRIIQITSLRVVGPQPLSCVLQPSDLVVLVLSPSALFRFAVHAH